MATQLDTALLTIEDAASKWCPESLSPKRGLDNDELLFVASRTDAGLINWTDRCVGDRCAFWRWHDRGERHQEPNVRVKAEFDRVGPADPGAWLGRPEDGRDWLLDEEDGWWYVPAPSLPPRGYCGKAGHPLQAMLVEAQIDLAHAQMRALD